MGASTGPVWASSKRTSSSLDIHITLHLPTQFCPNWTILERAKLHILMIPIFQDGGQGIAILLPVSVLVISGMVVARWSIFLSELLPSFRLYRGDELPLESSRSGDSRDFETLSSTY